MRCKFATFDSNETEINRNKIEHFECIASFIRTIMVNNNCSLEQRILSYDRNTKEEELRTFIA